MNPASNAASLGSQEKMEATVADAQIHATLRKMALRRNEKSMRIPIQSFRSMEQVFASFIGSK